MVGSVTPTRPRREQVTIRLSPEALARIDTHARDRELDRAQFIRDLLRLGLAAYEKGAR